MHAAIAIAACPVCEFKRSVVTNVEPDKIRGSELDDTQLWNVCVASTTIRIYALLLHIHSPHWGGGGGAQHHQGKQPRCFGWNLSHEVDFRNVEKWCVFLMDLFLVINVCPPMQIPAYMLHCFGVRTLDYLNGKRHHINPGHFLLLSIQSNQRILSQISNLI